MSVGLCRVQCRAWGKRDGNAKDPAHAIHRVAAYRLSPGSMSVSPGSPAASGKIQGFRELKDTCKVCHQGDGSSRKGLRLFIMRHGKNEQYDGYPGGIDDE